MHSNHPEKTRDDLDFTYISFQIKDALGDLQNLLARLTSGAINDDLFKIKLIIAMRKLNRAFNLRYKERHGLEASATGSYISQEILDEMGDDNWISRNTVQPDQ